MKMEISRREFLQTSGTVAASLVIGFHLPVRPARAQFGGPPNPFVIDRDMINAYLTLNPDETVSIVSAAAEMGQGSLSSLPMLIAEELELDIGQVRIEQAPLNQAAFRNLLFGYQTTVGTSAVRWAYEPLRQLGANTRELLRNAAAATWDVPVDETVARSGRVTHPASGRSLSYFALGETAAGMEIPAEVPLKPRSEWRILGTPFPRWDTEAKSTASANYGIDIHVDGMVVATIAATPAPGNVQGVAFAYSDESTVGEVFEASVSDDGRVKLHKITCVCDVGVYMNPMMIEHQMESAITWGLTSAMFGEILIEDGATRQKNFHEYEMVRISHMPAIETVILPPTDTPGSGGECGAPPAPPALANAIFAATGRRLRSMPFRNHGISFA